MHTANGLDENSLKLSGNKIKLTQRPSENQSTASSRCALLRKGYSRPVSAVPLLNLNYDNEFAFCISSKRRPLSADFPATKVIDTTYRTNMSLSQNRYESHYIDGETSLESSEETDSNLPSTQLLSNLLSEPIYSWRNGIRSKPIRKSKPLKKPTSKPNRQRSDCSDETPSAGSDTSSSTESTKLKSYKIHLPHTTAAGTKTTTPVSSEWNTERSTGRENENFSNSKQSKPHSTNSPMSVTFYEPVEIIPDSRYVDDDLQDSSCDSARITISSARSLESATNNIQTIDKKDDKPRIIVTDDTNKVVELPGCFLKSDSDKTKLDRTENISTGQASKELQPITSDSHTAKISDETNDPKTYNSMALVPGLKTKPPLPKKPDLSNLNSARMYRRNSSQNLIDDTGSKNGSNFEAITFDMLNYNVLTSGHDMKISLDEVAINNDQSDHEYCREQTTQPCSNNTETVQTSTATLSSDSEPIELKYQNWFQEEQKANNEILESQFKTDLSLHKLKVENDKKINDKLQNEHINKDVSNLQLQNDSKHAHAAHYSKDDKTSDVQTVKSNQNKHKRNATTKNFIKENIKLISAVPKRSTNTSANNFEVPQGKGFVPTPMKSFKEYKETNDYCDVESWMSSNSELCNNTEESDYGATQIEQNSHSKPAPYMNFLEEIDELHECCENLYEGDIPEQYKDTDQSDENTYDDIVSILQVLEEQDKKSHMKMESIKEIINNEITTIDCQSTKKAHFLSPNSPVNKPERVSPLPFREDYPNNERFDSTYCNDYGSSNRSKCREQEQSSRTSIHSSTNLNDLFSYLDEVDRNCAKSLACAKERIQTTAQVMENNIKLDTIPKLEELLVYTNVELSHHIIDLTLRLKDKSSSIALLQKELSSLRNQITKLTKDTNDTVKQRLKSQKEDYENVVKRHQKFIDQLIADKKTLNQQCEGLIHEMKVIEDRFNSNLKAAEHKHKIELQKIKEMHVAGEKYRRERWIDTKTQKIKELTVKGLEPELEKMAVRHQQEINDLRALHKREIEDLELRSARKMQQQCETLREQLTAEREKAIAHERDVLRQRYEQLVASEEQNYQEQRRRLLIEHTNRISECEERENAAVVERDRAIKQTQNDFEDRLQAAIRRHNTDLNVLKEKTELEMEAFRNNYKKQAAAQLSEKEMQIREKCRKERDKEIEAVIERLEIESNENKLQIEQSTENRIKRIKDKYEKEIKELECSEKESTTKYSETKTKLLEAEDAVIRLKATAKQLEIQLQETKQLSEKLSTERNQIKDVVREEMKQEIQVLEKEVQVLRNDKDKELQQVYARVKIAVARKDETISELTRDHTALQEKCAYLENMLEQQRKEYLMK